MGHLRPAVSGDSLPPQTQLYCHTALQLRQFCYNLPQNCFLYLFVHKHQPINHVTSYERILKKKFGKKCFDKIKSKTKEKEFDPNLAMVPYFYNVKKKNFLFVSPHFQNI